ncbi:MtrAB system accessory lipoprotein LpqB [Kitasatospora paracochleata]|uniref:Lipoprotein LpqB-like beta-propeller protein n=1 Tax=Kitasatospora paracochleata TaxID=58354 RepID=A0ABT1IY32_9ACTN|nr:LpqB family beta-propeller domain-containing protein [Kitasatospora paracochleata]MCP2310057.1 hypothetical protein [Kitasatospora paracochleata]
MRRTSRRTVDVGTALAVGVLATGCVAMPSGGPPERVEQSAAADDLQVHVYPVAPHPGELPADLLAGFLDSSNADQANYDTARQYLTADASHRWKPEAGVVVLAKIAQAVGSGAPQSGDAPVDVAVSGEQVARLDGKHTYSADHAGETYRQTFGFVKESEGPNKGEWRINSLPDGLIVDQTNFLNGYKAVHRYYFAVTDPSADHPVQVLVPDPIYLRRRIDPLTAAAEATAAGPSDWLAPAVSTALDGVRVKSVSVNDNRVATVRVEAADLSGRQQQCQQMAEQLFQTVADQQGKGQLDRLEVAGNQGGCAVSAQQVNQVAPGSLASGPSGGPAGAQAYFQLETGQLMRYQDGTQGVPVPGVLGQPTPAGQSKPSVIAVRRDGNAAAVVNQDGKALYLPGLGDTDKLGDLVVPSRAPRPDAGLASPSWDGRQDLWLVDRDPSAPRVLMVRTHAGGPAPHTVVPVQVDGIDGRTVQALRISSDGTRIALVLRSGTGATTVALGLVLHSGSQASPQVRITALRPVAPQLTGVASVAWADPDQLVVLGKEKDTLQQLHYLGTDGSAATDSPLQIGESMTSVSATEVRTGDNQGPPAVLTVSDTGIYRLKDNQLSEVPSKTRAVAFGYPG